VKLRLQTYHENLETVLKDYKDIIVKVDGNSTKEQVFEKIDAVISETLKKNKLK